MPFNVIAFTSTALAFFFGSLFNALYSTDAQIIERARQTPLSRMKGRIQRLLRRCRRRTAASAESADSPGEGMPPRDQDEAKGELEVKGEVREAEGLPERAEEASDETKAASDGSATARRRKGGGGHRMQDAAG